VTGEASNRRLALALAALWLFFIYAAAFSGWVQPEARGAVTADGTSYLDRSATEAGG